ncbi:hypothetical protein ACBJ59_53585 [Nonomuraea sp. MTCD27]|uniref:hypothetical protein n=1 Tax=Nonomuraea sp. MTCD27 TaxID=1676747 RepID=UPI0035C06D4F
MSRTYLFRPPSESPPVGLTAARLSAAPPPARIDGLTARGRRGDTAKLPVRNGFA